MDKGKIKTITLWTLLSILLLTLFGIIFGVSYVLGLEEWKNFEPKDVENMAVSLSIRDVDGDEYISLSGSEKRLYASIEDIPDHVKNAFIAIEDTRFYSHGGIDIYRIFGALIADIKSGSIKQGASTITQQLVKMTSLTSEQTIARKVTEIMMALKLEQEYSKDEILEMYINCAYYGAGAYGIRTASLTYFNKEPSELTLSEAATLAGVLKAPSIYSPHLDMEKSLYRRDTVLYQMLVNEFISEEEYDAAIAEKIKLNMQEESEYIYGYYTDLTLSQAEEALGVSAEELLSGGYVIYTSLDAELQKTVEALFADPENFPKNAKDGTQVEGAMIILNADNSTIAAVVGGREHTTRRAYNRAEAIRRQPGSAIKPVLVYAPAIDKHGYTAASFVEDAQINIDGWSPSSGNYLGTITLREAVALSRNTPAVRVLQDIGIDSAKDYASTVGIPFSESDANYSLALGGFTTGVSPLQLAGAYAPFANGGYYQTPSCILKITDRHGNTVYENSNRKYSVISENTAYIMSSILASSVEYGTAKRLKTENIPLSAKTGTSTYLDTSMNKDAWVVSMNPDYIMCCWMGFDTTNATHALPKGTTGGSYPALLTKQVFEHIYYGTEAPAFTQPSGILKVKLDLGKLNKKHELSCASIYASEGSYVYEYFSEKTAPESNFSNPILSAPREFSILRNQKGLPVIYFTPSSEDASYIILRTNSSTGETEEVAEFSKVIGRQFYVDNNISSGVEYTYRVLPAAYRGKKRYDGIATSGISFVRK